MNDRKANESKMTKAEPKTIPDFFGSLQYTNSLTAIQINQKLISYFLQVMRLFKKRQKIHSTQKTILSPVI